jgi:hypothetical protein
MHACLAEHVRLDDSDAPVLVTEPGWKDPCDTEEELVVRNTVRRGTCRDRGAKCVHVCFTIAGNRFHSFLRCLLACLSF